MALAVEIDKRLIQCRGHRSLRSSLSPCQRADVEGIGNWPSQPLADETLAGLKELGATEAAEIFDAAFACAKDHWAFICSGQFSDSYHDSPLERTLMPLNRRLWALLGYDGSAGKSLLACWAPYARSHPERVCHAN
jgi:hypothetical protein